MNAVWNAMVNEVQGVFVKPVDIKLPTVRYEMGVAVAKRSKAPKEHAIQTNTAGTVERTLSKADLVRELIRAAKGTNTPVEQVITEAAEKLKMARTLATAYVKNNWERAN